MARLGTGVYLSAYGTGAQTVTVDKATQAGDEFFAFGVTQVTAGGGPFTWQPPNPPFTHGLDFNSLSAGSHDGLNGTWVWMAHGAPGAVAAGQTYTFTHDNTLSMRSILVLLRCKEQVLSDGIGGGSGSTGAGFPVTSPATVAVNFPLANPGFDMLLFNNKGVQGANPTGDSPKLKAVALLSTAADNMDIGLYFQPASRNVAFVGNLSVAWGGTAVDGWRIIVATAQLGSTNTPSTLTFPVPLPDSGGGMRRLRTGGSMGGFAAGIRLPRFGIPTYGPPRRPAGGGR